MTDFVIQHEFDSDPIYIFPSNDDEGDYVTLGVDIPTDIRQKLAGIICNFLNQNQV